MDKNDLKRKRRLSVRLFFLFWAVITLSFFAFIFSQVNKYYLLVAEETRLYAQIDEEDKKNAGLRMDMDYYLSDAFVEKIAREQLDLIRPDEKLFYNDAKQE